MAANDLDRIKRRLIRNVARLKASKLSDDKIWKTLMRTQTFDCQALWERMKALTSKKLVRLFLSEDCTQQVTPVARMTDTDWLMFDLVLVHEPVEVMVMYEDKIPKNMEHLISLVLKYEIESRPPEDLVKAWVQLTMDYNACGRHCSPMLLQRRWYLLKEATRKSFYTLWFSHTNALHKATNLPSHLMTHLAARYPDLLTSPFLGWEEMVEKKYIVLPADLNKEFNEKSSKLSDTNEPDLVALESTIETIDLVDKEKSSEESNKSISNNIESKNVNNDEFKNNDHNDDTNLETKITSEENILCDMTYRTEANEVIIAIDNQPEKESIETNETMPEEIIACDDQKYYRSVSCESEVYNDIISINEVYNNNAKKLSDTDINLQSRENNRNKIYCKTECITEYRDGVENVDTPHELEITENNIAVEKSINEEIKDDLVKCDGLLNVKIIKTSHVSDPSITKSSDEIDMIINTTMIETNKELCKNESLSINKMLCDVTDDIIEDNNLLNNIQVNKELHLKLNFKSCEASNEIMDIKDFKEFSTDNAYNPDTNPEKRNFTDNIYTESIQNDNVINQPFDNTEGPLENLEKYDIIDTSEEDNLSDLEFVDEGIEFHEDDIDPNLQQIINSENVKENITKKCVLETDEKLIMLPKVYTKRIENINVLKNYNINETVNIYNIIDNIILESKPKYIQSQSMITEQVSEKSLLHFDNYAGDDTSDPTMKIDLTIDRMTINSKEYSPKCEDNNINFLKTLDDSNPIFASKNTNKLCDTNHQSEVNTIIKKTDKTKDYFDNSTSRVKAKTIFEDDEINTDVIKDKKEGNIYLASEVNKDVIDIATEIVKYDLDSPFLKKPMNCQYNPIMLCKNPDFNTRLKRLPFGFISIPNNYLMIKACKPLTIDMHKTFESKLVNGVLYLKSSTADIGQKKCSIISKATSTTTSVMPSALPAQSLVDYVKVNINDFVPTQNNKTDYESKNTTKLHTNSVVTDNNLEINDNSKKITENDIAACNEKCNNADQEPNTVKKLTNNNITNTQQNNLQKNDAGKKKKTFRNRINVPWFARNSANLQNVYDNVLLAKDSVDKMLRHLRNVYNHSESIFCFNKIDPIYTTSAVKVTVIDDILTTDNKDLQEKNINKKKCTTKIIRTRIKQPQLSLDQSTNTNNDIKNNCILNEEQKSANDGREIIRRKRRKYCCWIKRKVIYDIVNDEIPNLRVHFTKHSHSNYDNCDCCCKIYDEEHMYKIVQDFIKECLESSEISKLNFNLIKFTKLKESNIAGNISNDKSIPNPKQKYENIFIERIQLSELDDIHQNKHKILKANLNFELPDGVHLILLPNGKVKAMVEPGVPKLSEDIMQNILEHSLNVQHKIKNNKKLLTSYTENIQNQTLEKTNNLKNKLNINNGIKFGPTIGCKKGKICIDANSFSPIINNANFNKKTHLFVIRPHRSKTKPIYLGKNKILLTTTNLNKLEMTEQSAASQLLQKNTQNYNVYSKFDLPNGVNLKIFSNGKVEVVVEPGLTFSHEKLNKIVGYATVIQYEIKKRLDLLINSVDLQNKTLENILNQIHNLENEVLNRDNIQINTCNKIITKGCINELNILDVNTNFHNESGKTPNHSKNYEESLVIDLDKPENNLQLDTCADSTANTKCYPNTTDSQNKKNLQDQSNISELMNTNIKINDDNNQSNSSTNIGTNEKKTILSDLMEMSGISTEDTIITENIQLNSDDINNEIQMNLITWKTKDILELSPVTSIAELKFATRSSGKFYSLNLDTGQVFSLKIDVRKNSNNDPIVKTTKNNPSNKKKNKDFIEINDSDSDCLVNDAKQPATATKERKKNNELKRKIKYVSVLKRNINSVNKSKSLIKTTIQSQKDAPGSSQIESLRSMTFDDDSDDEPLIKVKRKMNTSKDEGTNPDQTKNTVQNFNQICDLVQIDETVEYLDEESDSDQEENIQNMNIVSNPKQIDDNILLNKTSPDQEEESIEYLSNEIFDTLEKSDEDSLPQDEPMEWENTEVCKDNEAILGL